MKTKLASLAACALMIGCGALFAAEATPAKEVTLTGTMECGKCELHMTKKCQDVLKVKEGDKDVLYFLEPNKVSNAYHKNVCAAPEDNVTVTGTVAEKDGKKMIDATKITGPAAG